MKVPILESIIKYREEKNLILSMPGNKCGLSFTGDSLGKQFKNLMGELDITEVEPLDNLHHPEGIIEESLNLLKNYYGGKKAYFITNGSTGGNLISIFSAFNEEDRVLVERNCHRSIYNGLVLRKLKVSYIEGEVDEELDVVMPPTARDIRNAIEENKDIKGVILTYPNYFGTCYEIEELIEELKEKNIKTIIDSAHGAHFNCSEKLPKSLTSIADYIVLSAHKTIPALTQSGYLIVNNIEDNVDFYFSALTSTSPSYLLMASLDYGRYYMETYGEKHYSELIDRCEKWKKIIEEIDGITIYRPKEEGYIVDRSRYVLYLEKGYSGELLLEYLRREKIQCEMSFKRGVVLIFSPFNTEADFSKLYESLKKLDFKILEDKTYNVKRCNSYERKKIYEPYEVTNMKELEVEFSKKIIGKISKEHIVPYPPGIPLLCPGEVINEEIYLIIKDYLDSETEILGINRGKIKIIK